MRIVLKFGGSSLANAQRIRVAAQRVAELKRQGHEVVAVVSAQGDTTDDMIARANEITQNPPVRELDAYLAAGEQMSAGLLAMAMAELGIPGVSLTGWQMGLITDGVHGNARVLGLRDDRIQKELEKGNAVIAMGFQGIDGAGDITTLGRGGSDTTAVALAAFLKADICRIYTDVDGIYDKDPRIFPDAVKFSQIGYEEMLRMARHGAQVLHDRCVELAQMYRVPVEVLSSFRALPGTLMTDISEDSVQI